MVCYQGFRSDLLLLRKFSMDGPLWYVWSCVVEAINMLVVSGAHSMQPEDSFLVLMLPSYVIEFPDPTLIFGPLTFP